MKFLLLVLLAVAPVAAQAQNAGSGYFTLTNGNLWWFNGEENDDDGSKYFTAYEYNSTTGDWEPVYHQLLEGMQVTHITEQGNYYFALDTSDRDHPVVAARLVSDGFDPLCAWYRTGYTGYYYQEWNGYRYYIVASSGAGLHIIKVAIGQPMTQSTYWYNWDFGAAFEESAIVEGASQSSYYWITYDTSHTNAANPLWTLSGDTYQRPETRKVSRRNVSGVEVVDTDYFYGYSDATGRHPYGTGALYLPVEVIHHTSSNLSPITGFGLDTVIAADNEVSYLDSTTLSAKVMVNTALGVPIPYLPDYTEYREETYRRGINLNYRNRTREGVFGSAGIATINTWYYIDSSHTISTTAPNPDQSVTNNLVDSVHFEIESRYHRYVSLGAVTPASPATDRDTTTLMEQLMELTSWGMPADTTFSEYYGDSSMYAPGDGYIHYLTQTNAVLRSYSAVLICHHPPMQPLDVHITATVHYHNGSTQSGDIIVRIKYDQPTTIPEAVHGPVVRGSVFGGGRMASVGGNTGITIHNTDSIYALYGGNDVAGWVQGDSGATIQLGTQYTNADHPVHISYVYGGGCGLYQYDECFDAVEFATNKPAIPSNVTDTLAWATANMAAIDAAYNAAWGAAGNPKKGLGYGQYAFRGKVYGWDKDAQGNLVEIFDNTQFDYAPYKGYRDFNLFETGNNAVEGKLAGTIPYVKTAHITVGVPEADRINAPFIDVRGDSTHIHNDYIRIDSLFGGAENAFIGVTSNDANNPENGVTLDVNGGTIYALFGGNNYGGSVANTSTVYVDIFDTKLVHEDDQPDDSYISGYGRDFGIRYLFGGGNKVDGSNSHVNIYGGMIDTAYVGGNSASVQNPIGVIECQPSATTNQYGHLGHYICTNPSYPSPLEADAVRANPDNYLDAEGNYLYGPDNWEGEVGQYNIRCLFAGNNSADMENLSVVQLHAGGISSVYGGCNQGDMLNDKGVGAFSNPIYQSILLNAFDINPTTGQPIDGGWTDIFGFSALPNKVGTVISALHDSKITCDYIYGGARMGNIKHSCGVYVAGGVFGYINGGNDISGDVGSETDGGSYTVLDSNVFVVSDVAGGSDGFYHCDNGTGHYASGGLYDSYSGESYDPYDEYEGMLMPTQNNSNIYMRGGQIMGALIAGGLHTNVGFANGATPLIKKRVTDTTTGITSRQETAMNLDAVGGPMHGKVRMMLTGGHIYTDVYGGGYQSDIYGLAYERVKGDITIDGSLFAGNDVVGSIHSFGPYHGEINYSGCNNANDSLVADTNAYAAFTNSLGERLNKRESDGSYNALYDAYLRIEGTPTITRVYGSGNGNFLYDGTDVSFCEGSNGVDRPLQSSTFIDINTSGGNIDTVFGGGNGVGVERAVTVLLNNTASNVNTVHTIFGGNNLDDMSIVPEVRLMKGQVNNVYGGSNNGNMTAWETFTDAYGQEVTGVSTHVVVNSDNVTVLDTLYGGNRMSNVDGTSFVEIRNTSADGVNTVFGGNDISGNIGGTTRVDISGGKVTHLFGGSNGNYDYLEVGDALFMVYPQGSVASGDTAGKLITIAGQPNVDSTTIIISGGIIDSSLYGGGSMAECRSTYVNIEEGDGKNIELHATIFGGGMGYWKDLNQRNPQGKRYGNITGATHVDLHSATTVSSAEAYGGGKGGDVMNSYITVYPTWTKQFDALFGGCWGSDVFGSTHVTINATDNGDVNIAELFGGNDFSGDVYHSNVTINSGRFGNIYGAGNGDYPASDYTSGVYAGNSNNLHAPNVEYVNVDFNDGTVESNLYGGGKLGTTFAYKKDSTTREYVLNNGHKIPDTTMTLAEAHSNPLDYSYIITNVHGGQFDNNIFGGAHGSETDKKPLVYGLKMVNMDGGDVYESVYGGSEYINDGYLSECSHTQSTARPSSILNITGGTIENNVYGGGYLGNVFGSVYLNIGQEAVNLCPVWGRHHVAGDSTYIKLKPGATDGLVPALATRQLLLESSVYGGANWAENTGSSNFATDGFFGGESRVLIDGRGYNTYNNDAQQQLPLMDIRHSIIGSGTSANGGDLYNRIDIRNYGAIDPNTCKSTRSLHAIQRTNALWLANTSIDYTGSTDAISAYISQQYTLNRIDTLNCVGYNILDIDATASNIGEANFYHYRGWGDPGTQNPYADRELVQNTDPNLPTCSTADDNCEACVSTPSVCDQLQYLERPEIDPARSFSAMVMNNGINVDFISAEGEYANIYGFAYIVAEPYTNAIITANAKYKYEDANGYDAGVYTDPTRLSESAGEEFGGFLSICSDSLKAIRNATGDSNEVLEWCNCLFDGGYPVAVDTNGNELDTNYCMDTYETYSIGQYPYFNYGTEYRVWSIGHGVRKRYAVIQAHANPSKLDTNKTVLLRLNGQDNTLCIAKSTLELPPTTPGHYYKIKPEAGVVIADDNGDMKLVDRAWRPADWHAMKDSPTVYDTIGHHSPESNWVWNGSWVEVKDSSCNDLVSVDVNKLHENPGKYFGLILSSGPNFVQGAGGIPQGVPVAAAGQDPDCGWTGYTIVQGNDHVSSVNYFTTAKVADAEHTKPTLDLYLTYDSNFSQTLLGTVDFTLQEFDENNNDMHSDIQVQITISTILEDFNDMEEHVLAMYNEGVSNTFIRKAVFPATLQMRELYLQSIEWEPIKSDGTAYTSSDAEPDNFQLINTQEKVLAANDTKTFSISIQPVENVSNTLVTSVGWHRINQKEPLNLFDAVGTLRSASKVSRGTWKNPQAVTLTANNGKGIKLGELDGRGEAALDVIFNYDGNKVYPATPDKGFVGKAVLKLAAYKGSLMMGEPFYLTVDVKTRAHGDTIYIASAPTLPKPGGGYYTGISEINNQNKSDAGKRPSKYVTSFQNAFHPDVYEEGDVIAVLDTVSITGGNQLLIKGYDNSPVQVIRYTGSHPDMPGEEWVYRGTMLNVAGSGSSFTARNIDFNGSLNGKLYTTWSSNPNPSVYKQLYFQGNPMAHKYSDTNRAFGPIIAVHDNATVALQNGVLVRQNYNSYQGDDARKRGAISVTSNGQLSLLNNVTIEQNLSDSLNGDTRIHPLNGAVFVKNGRVVLNASNAITSVSIIDNYLKPNTQFWTEYRDATNHLTRYAFDTSSAKTSNYTKANVYLSRLPKTGAGVDVDMEDSISDVIQFIDNVTKGTRIGISKWFPDEDENKRDTMRIVYQSTATHLKEVQNSNNFISDDGFNTFYNYGVNNQNMYLHRCASFRQQVAGQNPTLPGNGFYAAGDLLDYKPLLSAACPTGGDTLIYRVQGGFMPYTFTWNGNVSGEKETPYTNNEVMKRVSQGDMSYYIQSVADTIYTTNVNMTHTDSVAFINYTVTANDATGNCPLTKQIQVKLHKDTSSTLTNNDLFVETNSGWTSPSVSEATGVRNFRAIKITPMVWADRSLGTIVAQIVNDPKDSIYTEEDGHPVLDGLTFCEGDIIRLHTAPRRNASGDPVSNFIMWDFDPYYGNPATYVVPAKRDTVIAYYGPLTHWDEAVTRMADAGGVYDDNYYYTTRPTVAGYTSTDGSNKAGYVTTQSGDVHIYDEKGLAWFISVVNGINGTQARPFYYNKVYLHKKQDNTDYDMKDYLWTPVGSSQHHFHGHFYGVGSADNDTTPLVTGRVNIKNIIVDEPYALKAGFFAELDTANISSIKLQNALIRGSQYVGALAARSAYTKVDNCAVNQMNERGTSKTILTTRHTSGGMIGYSVGDSISNSEVNAKYIGDAIYSGGLLGYARNSQIVNNVGRNDNRMEGLYISGIVGYLEDTSAHGNKANYHPAMIANNYVHLITDGNAQRVGGIVGYATGGIIENNYVYGTLKGSATEGGVGAVLGAGSRSSHNYYEQSAVDREAGQVRAGAFTAENSDFNGSGNQVKLGSTSYGIDNLTRALNLWVRENGMRYRSWRSDLEGTNNGYPIFGTPDMIPVSDTVTLDICDSAVVGGRIYTYDTTFEFHVIDSVQMIDSTSLFTLLVHHSTSEQYYDSTTLGEPYSGHGFEITAAETELLSEAVTAYGSATLIVSDTLTTATGCDSIVSLYLTITSAHDTTTVLPAGSIRVFPNPAIEYVTVETQGLNHVELFDNTGRRMQDYQTADDTRLTIDLKLYATGVYYLRIYNNEGVTIQKLIKD